MSDYREIRVRLNLEHPQDRWLASALEETTEALGAPVASIVRRALTAYLRDYTRARTSGAPSISMSERANAQAQGVEHEGIGEHAAPLTSNGPTAERADPWVHDDGEPIDVKDNLASMGVPPELPKSQ